MEVNGSHVVITGGSRGIGAAMARDLAGKGANVTFVARSAEAVTSLADELGGQAVRPILSIVNKSTGSFRRSNPRSATATPRSTMPDLRPRRSFTK